MLVDSTQHAESSTSLFVGSVRAVSETGAYVALKCVSKNYVAKHGDERHVHNERTILRKLR